MNFHSHQEPSLQQKIRYGAKVALVFLSAFAAMTIFEINNYQQSNRQVDQNMTRISNVHSDINSSNLNQYKGRTLILYSSTCKACHEIIPKYYGLNRLTDSLTFHKAPIYLDINQGENRDIFNELSVASTPKKVKVDDINYDKNTQQINSVEQSQSDVSPLRSVWLLVFINIFWSALISLIYIALWDGFRYLIRRTHSDIPK